MSRHKSPARKLRRKAYREAVADVQRQSGAPRRLAAQYVQENTSGGWRTFGLPYTGFGAPVLGPPAPVKRKEPVAPRGVRGDS